MSTQQEQLQLSYINWVEKMHKSERPGIALWVNIVSDSERGEMRWAKQQVSWRRIETNRENLRRVKTRRDLLGRVEKSREEVKRVEVRGRDGTTLRAVGSCSCWKELQKLRRAEMVWEDLKSGGRNWKGRRQNDVELKEQSCEAVRSVVAAPIGKTCFQDPIAAHFL